MHSKPMGEPRTPNSAWSGMGFSSSMPEAVIRQKMEAEHARAKEQREKEVASNSDNWFARSNAFDSLLGPPGGHSGMNFWSMQGPIKIKSLRSVHSDSGHDELTTLLTSQGLGKYADVFLRHEVDLQTFATLTDEELKEIGIPTFGARKKLLLLARETRKTYGVS